MCVSEREKEILNFDVPLEKGVCRCMLEASSSGCAVTVGCYLAMMREWIL